MRFSCFLCIIKYQLIAVLFCKCRLKRFRIRSSPVRFCTHLCVSNGDRFPSAASFCSPSEEASAAGLFCLCLSWCCSLFWTLLDCWCMRLLTLLQLLLMLRIKIFFSYDGSSFLITSHLFYGFIMQNAPYILYRASFSKKCVFLWTFHNFLCFLWKKLYFLLRNILKQVPTPFQTLPGSRDLHNTSSGAGPHY